MLTTRRGEPGIWQAIWNARGPWTDRFLLAALDLKRSDDGTIQNDGRTIYRAIYLRSFIISLSVTALCLLLGLPVAVYLASLPAARAMPLLLVLMLPFVDLGAGAGDGVDPAAAEHRRRQ